MQVPPGVSGRAAQYTGSVDNDPFAKMLKNLVMGQLNPIPGM